MALKPKPDSFTSYGMGDECFCSFCRKAFTIESSEEALFGECPECISAKLDDREASSKKRKKEHQTDDEESQDEGDSSSESTDSSESGVDFVGEVTQVEKVDGDDVEKTSKKCMLDGNFDANEAFKIPGLDDSALPQAKNLNEKREDYSADHDQNIPRCGCACGEQVVELEKPHSCIDPNHDKSMGKLLFGGVCLREEDHGKWHGTCKTCDLRNKLKIKAISENILHEDPDNLVDSSINVMLENSLLPGTSTSLAVDDLHKKKEDNFVRKDILYTRWCPSSWNGKPRRSPKLYTTTAETDMPMLHQVIPIGAVTFIKKTKDDVHLFSRSLVANVDPDEDVKAFILAQLFYYKCTSAPIYALVIDPTDKTFKVIKDPKNFKTLDANFTQKDNEICSEVTTEYIHEKRQRPEGIISKKTGKWESYFVWDGGVKSDKPDKGELGYFNYLSASGEKEIKALKADLKKQALSKTQSEPAAVTPNARKNKEKDLELPAVAEKKRRGRPKRGNEGIRKQPIRLPKKRKETNVDQHDKERYFADKSLNDTPSLVEGYENFDTAFVPEKNPTKGKGGKDGGKKSTNRVLEGDVQGSTNNAEVVVVPGSLLDDILKKMTALETTLSEQKEKVVISSNEKTDTIASRTDNLVDMTMINKSNVNNSSKRKKRRIIRRIYHDILPKETQNNDDAELLESGVDGTANQIAKIEECKGIDAAKIGVQASTEHKRQKTLSDRDKKVAALYTTHEVLKERLIRLEEHSHLAAEHALLKERMWKEKYLALQMKFDEKKRCEDFDEMFD